MISKIVAVAIIIILTLFLLSVFGPMHSQRKFWIAIRKIRAGMDFISYWFFNLCAIATVIFIVWMVVRALLNR